MSNPHADFQSVASTRSGDAFAERDTSDSQSEQARTCRTPSSAGALLLRTAECLTALLQAPTVHAGLNESRYNVLDALRRKPSGTSSQTELATHLLQSESNLSTLLDRMKNDGLISRARSERDRRVTRIGISTAGRDALTRADRARQSATAPLLRVLDERLAAALVEALEILRGKLEGALGVADRMQTTVEDAGAARLSHTDASSDSRKSRVHPPRRRESALDLDGPNR
jgi:DNA-binding MarR family transcriptional regulator